jgi:aminoglycoside phosphotransferase (APT) family kinase protein
MPQKPKPLDDTASMRAWFGVELRNWRTARGMSTAALGVSSEGAELIGFAENELWRLPGGIVVRIARPGQAAAAAREVAVTRWLGERGFPAVRPLPMAQPVQVGERAATFWEELPPHRHGTAVDLAPLLRRLHDLPVPDGLSLGQLDPFVRIAERLSAARGVTGADRTFLLARLDELRLEWGRLPAGRPACVVHGDAWGGNCAITADGRRVLMDFERTSLGCPEWDLTSTAVGYDTFGSVSGAVYDAFRAAYGYDVREWAGYPTLRGIRELRMATFAVQAAERSPESLRQAEYRITCLRGERGPRPWGWAAVS